MKGIEREEEEKVILMKDQKKQQVEVQREARREKVIERIHQMDKDRLLRNQKWKVENKELISLVKPKAVNEPLFKRMGQEYVVKVEEHNLELK